VGLQLLALLVLPIVVGTLIPRLWVHPFGPLTKNVPLLVGTGVVFLRHTPFLTAEWSHILLFTFSVPRQLVESTLPPGVSCQLRGEAALLSLVSLDFQNTRVWGIPWPGLRNFTGINLRTYAVEGERAGVVFVREFVSSKLIALAAKRLYGEPFESVPIRSCVTEEAERIRIERRFQRGGKDHVLYAVAAKASVSLPSDDEAHFFKERYWGFGRSHWGESTSYQLEHPIWRVHPIESWHLDIDWRKAYGETWSFLQNAQPLSVVVADGSPVRMWFPV
jgi:uncharacterized protein YqjF (DUF2071 family)